MGTKLTPSGTWAGDVFTPNPGEPVRAGGGTGTPITIGGDAGSVNGDLTYTGLVAGVRVRHLGGTSKTLGVTVNGTTIDVQLETDGGGASTGTATATRTAVLTAAAALVTVTAGGTGGSPPGIEAWWHDISNGILGSIRVPMQSLTDRTDFLYQYGGTHQPPVLFKCDDGAVLAIVGMAGFGNKSLYTSTTYTPAGLAADTWYYLYRNTSAAFVMSTAPDVALSTLSGDGTKRYVGCFRTDGAGAIVRFTAQHGNYLWHEQQIFYSHPTALTFAAWQTISLATRVSPTARVAKVELDIIAAAAGSVFKIRPKSSTTTTGRAWNLAMGDHIYVPELTIALDESQRFEYGITNGNAGTNEAALSVLGFTER